MKSRITIGFDLKGLPPQLTGLPSFVLPWVIQGLINGAISEHRKKLDAAGVFVDEVTVKVDRIESL